jgi:hypothetical protein
MNSENYTNNQKTYLFFNRRFYHILILTITGDFMKIMISLNKSKVPYDELMDAARHDAPLFNEMALEWKMWVENKEEGIIGGIYYFKDQEDLEKSLAQGKAKSRLLPLIENLSKQVFDVIEDLSEINNAPI